MAMRRVILHAGPDRIGRSPIGNGGSPSDRELTWVKEFPAGNRYGLVVNTPEVTTMLVSRSDFQIKAENFDLTQGWNILRIISGAFMFPHVAGKFAGGVVSAATVGFFAKAGFHPPELWVYLAAFSESLCGIALILGICTRFASLGAAAVLGIAVYSLQVVKGFGWTWNTGGYEYPVFWGIVCIAVAIEAWKTYLAQQRVTSLTGMARAAE